MTKSTKTKAAPATETTSPPGRTKRDIIVGLLGRTECASLDEMVAATGWLPHTTRAMLTGLKKKGHNVTSDKVDGVRRYRITTAAPDAQ